MLGNPWTAEAINLPMRLGYRLSLALIGATILVNAFRATERLAKAQPKADFQPLVRPLEQLVAADQETLREAYIEAVLVSEAQRVLEYLQSR